MPRKMKHESEPVTLRGRKPLDPAGERMKVRHVRATDAQWARYHELGGILAFRAWLDTAQR